MIYLVIIWLDRSNMYALQPFTSPCTNKLNQCLGRKLTENASSETSNKLMKLTLLKDNRILSLFFIKSVSFKHITTGVLPFFYLHYMSNIATSRFAGLAPTHEVRANLQFLYILP